MIVVEYFHPLPCFENFVMWFKIIVFFLYEEFQYGVECSYERTIDCFGIGMEEQILSNENLTVKQNNYSSLPENYVDSME